jgi:Holliday junction DNA helicase RuvA
VPGPAPAAAAAPWHDQVRAGLVNLGWAARDAEQAITAVESELAASGGPADAATALRAALRRLSTP